MSRTFESSANGALADDATLECGVCWWVYDPSKGEDIWDTPPGTPFTALPEHWRCPACDAPKSKFMELEAGAASVDPGTESLETRIASLVAAYEAAEQNIIGLPVHNDQPRIEAVGFRSFQNGYVGVMVCPWSMNLTFVPAAPDAPLSGPLGGSRSLVFPSGSYSFIIGRMENFGTVETCSLFSPMDEFDDPQAAKLAAEAAMEALFEAPEPAPPPAPKPVTRRFLLTVNGHSQ